MWPYSLGLIMKSLRISCQLFLYHTRIIAIAYCCYSSDMQREENMEAQKRVIHNFAKAKGIEIIEEYIERAQSATSADRPAFQKMLSDAQEMIFAMYNDGFSYTEVLKELNSCGYQIKRDGKFGKNSLYEILKNEKCIGVYTYNKSAAKGIDGKYNRHSCKDDSEIIRIENGIPAIIDKTLLGAGKDEMDAASFRRT